MVTNCPDAAGAMFRLVVDLTTRPLLPPEGGDAPGLTSKVRRDLGLRLPWLFDNGLLPRELRELSHCIREDDNNGAHAGTLTRKTPWTSKISPSSLLERVFTERERLKLAEVKRAKRRAQVAGAKSAAERNSRKPQDYRWQTNKTRRISARERSRSCRLRAGRESRCWLDFITYACRHMCGEVEVGLAAACHFVASLPDYPHSRNIVQPPDRV